MKIINCKGGFYYKLEKKRQRLEEVKAHLIEAKRFYWKYWWRKMFLRDNEAGESLIQQKEKIYAFEGEIDKIKNDLYSLEKGQAGEEKVIHLLKEKLNHRYVLVNNFNFVENDFRWEIDHILVSPAGLFLIETKNIKGRIFIQDGEEYWFKTPLNNPDAIKTPMKNPQRQIIQSKQGLKRWVENTSLHGINFYPVVVFPRYSCLLLNRELASFVPVIYHDEIIEYISWQEQEIASNKNVNEMLDVLIRKQKD